MSEQQSTKYSNVDYVFEDIKDYVEYVLNGYKPSLVITGDPGVGKTYTVLEKIKQFADEKGIDHIEHTKLTGGISAFGLYRSLFTNNGKLILFDDIDSIWRNETCASILKGALDSTGERYIAWEKSGSFNPEYFEESTVQEMILRGKLPSPFKFTGKVIFISNLKPHELDPAVRDRSMVVDLDMDPVEIYKIIDRLKYEVVCEGSPSREVREEVFDLIKQNFSKKDKKPSVRLYGTCLFLYNQALLKGDRAKGIRRVMEQIV